MDPPTRREALCEGLIERLTRCGGNGFAACWHLPQALPFAPQHSGFAIARILAQIGVLMPRMALDALVTNWHHACLMAHEHRVRERSDPVVVNGRE